MKTLIFLPVLLVASFTSFAETKRATFDGSTNEFRWSLKELSPDLPADWSSYQYLTLEFWASSPQRFELRVFTTNGTRRIRLHAFPGAWIRAAIPLAYFQKPDQQGFDLASLGNKSRAAYWINLMGGYGPVNAVEAIGVAMQDPLGTPFIDIRSARLDKESPGDEVLEPKPLVDPFGQWALDNWPDKAKSLDDLKEDWDFEDKETEYAPYIGCRYGGYSDTQGPGAITGFFHVQQIDGRWWFIDPDGHLFFSTGVDVISPTAGTRTEGRDGVFAALPPAELQITGGRGGFAPVVSFYTWNLVRRFGPDYVDPWLSFTRRRMIFWGLNTIGNWADSRVINWKIRPYVATLRGWGIETGVLGMPDVYSDEFAKRVDAAAAEQCTPHKEDSFLIGYFIANEPPWPGREAEIVTAILNGPTNAIQREAKAFLASGDTPARRVEFVNRCVEKFLTTVNAAIRKYDPNHLNLGIRFGSTPSEAMLQACKGFDVFSMNSYGTEVNRQRLETAYRVTGKPIIIGEFHFGTPGRGMAAGLVQTKNQEERGVAYRYYVENAAAHPAVIGTHWFQWVDEPNTGRNDGENYNIGLVDVTDRPYVELIKYMRATHAHLLEIHSGHEQPATRKPVAR